MSSCGTGAWKVPDVIRTRVLFTDGTDFPLTVYRVGRKVEGFEADDVFYGPQPDDEEWVMEDGRIAAIVRGGITYRREP